ncbi:MAG: carboxypeptidase regulatory-like domain-containing protein [Acidobacteria bacterium]|nr:carboxypeptidase regulatory-like domain-containing protein [Acidobacteriota bacterium]
MATVTQGGRSAPLQVAGVRVEEAFKGVEPGQEIALRQPLNSCSPDYKVGDRVLFYLHPGDEKGTWVAPGCHRSRDAADAADDFLFLRALPGSLKATRISGEVELYERSPSAGFRRQRPLAGLRVRIAGDRSIKEAFTNADGVYEVYGMPGGRYKVDVEVPPRMKLDLAINSGRQNFAQKPGEIELRENSGVGVSFVLMSDNRMSGRVLGPGGNPMEDVCVYLESVPNPGTGRYVSGCSKNGGVFELAEMPAGDYRLIVNPNGRRTSTEPFGTLYYPGTPDRAKAGIVTIGEGEHIDHLDIRIPALSRRIRVSGRMQFDDGTAIPGQFVTFTESGGAYTEHAMTEGDGSFLLTLVAGVSGEVRGKIWVDRDSARKCPGFPARFNPEGFIAELAAPPVVVSGDDDEAGVVLTLPFPSCREWRNLGAGRR